MNYPDCDRYMFVVRNNRPGFDTLSPTILNQTNIYDSSSNDKKNGLLQKGNCKKNISKIKG